MHFIVHFVLLLIPSIVIVTSFQCMDENNNPVDWFLVYKLPTIKHQGKLLKAGVAHVFMTSQNYSSWTLSSKSINDTTSIIGNTLKGLYDSERNTLFYLLYNDQPPNRKSKLNKGHNKGVVLANSTGGFWLVHSVPHFPSLEKTYVYPRTGAVFGQSFLCISLDLKNLNEVGRQLQYNEPEIYGENILSNLKSNLPDLTSAAENNTITNPPWYRSTVLVSNKGIQFQSFAKSKEFLKDLYEDWVAPELQTDLFVETWPNGADRLPSNCSKSFKVYNVASVGISSINVTFTTTHDHSKWAVSTKNSTKNWLCVGDINRMEHQKMRGGGTVCTNNKNISKNYKKLVETIEKCLKK